MTITAQDAWKALHEAYQRDAARKVTYEGPDWYQITPEEMKVFGLSMRSMPYVVTAYRYYEEILDLTDTGLLPPAIMAVIRKDLAERIGMETAVLDRGEFQKFATHLGISHRRAHAWYAKHEFWCVRQSIIRYPDENE